MINFATMESSRILRALLATFTALCAAGAHAQTAQTVSGKFKSGYLTFEVTSDSTVALTFVDAVENVVIPDTVGGYRVTRVTPEAFRWCSQMTSLVIPKSVTSIEANFGGDHGYSALTAVFVDNDNPSYCSASGVLFDKGKTRIIVYPKANASRTYTIPTTVGSIADGTFALCKALEEVNVPASVRSIGSRAFARCSSLRHISLPDSLATLGQSAFDLCVSLDSVSVPGSVRHLPAATFSGCKGLRAVTLGEGLASIGNGAFANCGNLGRIDLPSTLQYIGTGAFSDCDELHSLRLPAGLRKIEDDAISRCKGLTRLEVDKGNKWFFEKEGVLFSADTSTVILCAKPHERFFVYLPSRVKWLAPCAFWGCEGLVAV